jgi:DNA-binding MarR family transcriptional regulator
VTDAKPRYEQVSIPALLRHARNTYGAAMRRALEEAGYDDIPKNGLYVIGGMAPAAGNVPLADLIRGLRLSKQAAGQLVDALVTRGYLERAVDARDRRKLNVTLTERGRDAARSQAAARDAIDAELTQRVGARAVSAMRLALGALLDIGRPQDNGASP